jgi:arylsulfatase A-like enzyme
MRASGTIPAWLKGFPAYLREAGYYTTNSAMTDYNDSGEAAESRRLHRLVGGHGLLSGSVSVSGAILSVRYSADPS